MNNLLTLFSIIQWNAQSFNAHGDSLSQFISTLHDTPHILCIQETWFQPPYILKVKNYSNVCKHNPNGTLRGGCAIYIHNSISYMPINISCSHQAAGVQVSIDGKQVIIISIYTPESKLDFDSLQTFIDSSDLPLIICGDFDSHHTFWGSKHIDKKGTYLIEFIDKNNLVLLNDGAGTRICNTGKLSPLDLTLISPGIARNTNWKVLEDDCGSDHLPIETIFTKIMIEKQSKTPKWNYKKADWELYTNLCSKYLNLENYVPVDNIEEMYSKIITTLISIANRCVPKTKYVEGKPSKPWWNKECSEVVKEK